LILLVIKLFSSNHTPADPLRMSSLFKGTRLSVGSPHSTPSRNRKRRGKTSLHCVNKPNLNSASFHWELAVSLCFVVAKNPVVFGFAAVYEPNQI